MRYTRTVLNYYISNFATFHGFILEKNNGNNLHVTHSFIKLIFDVSACLPVTDKFNEPKSLNDDNNKTSSVSWKELSKNHTVSDKF